MAEAKASGRRGADCGLITPEKTHRCCRNARGRGCEEQFLKSNLRPTQLPGTNEEILHLAASAGIKAKQGDQRQSVGVDVGECRRIWRTRHHSIDKPPRSIDIRVCLRRRTVACERMACTDPCTWSINSQ